MGLPEGAGLSQELGAARVVWEARGDGLQGVCAGGSVRELRRRRLTLHTVLQASRSGVTCGLLLGDPRATQESLTRILYQELSYYSLLRHSKFA